jgi:hypothetical protein
MALDPSYQALHARARELQYNFQDILGHGNPTADLLHREARELVDDIEKSKNPRDLENRIKIIQNQMKQIEHRGQNLMSYDHANAIHHNYETMRQDIRRFHNYS